MKSTIRRKFHLFLGALLILALALPVALTAGTASAAAPSLSGYEVVISSQLNYGDGGWGGWSCPAGKVVLSGGFKATGPVEVSAPGTPGSVWPHYTFGANEYGWVVRDLSDGASNTIFIYAVCADPPPGYQVVKSSPQNYSDSGFAGWSCPANKVVTGGGFELPGSSAAVSVPAKPGSVWPHYTFGANEYGWVVGADEDGASSPGSRVYAICTDPLLGYEVGTSSALSFGDTGYGGWSTPAGKAVLGGGWRGTDSVRTSAPGTPGSVWPHYTFGANEYGWVLSDAPNGAGQTMTVYYIAGTWPPPLPSAPSVGISATDATICVGEPTIIDVNFANVTDLYGYEFKVNYPVTGFTATGAFVNDWFDTTGAFIPWDGTPDGGVVKFAASKRAPAMPVSGSGTVAQVTLTAIEAGVYDITLSDVLLGDRDGNKITADVAPNKVTVEVCGLATVKGKVLLQGRGTPPTGTLPPTSGTVTLADAGYGPFSASFDATGAFTINNVKVAPGGTSYTVTAAHGLYLSNTRVEPLTSGATVTLPDTKLKGGDAENSGTIGVEDLACIGGAFGVMPPAVCGTGSSDINADGLVNILDLVLPGGNYGLTTPQGW